MHRRATQRREAQDASRSPAGIPAHRRRSSQATRLQRALGNRGVRQLQQTTAAARARDGVARRPVLSRPGDAREQAAARIADEVARVVPDTAVAPPGWRGSPAAGGRLPGPVRTHFEGLLGTDLSDVQIHADAHADEVADRLGANAVTHRSSIYFAAGRYAPATPTGRRLLAHELVHTVQQRFEDEPLVQRDPRGNVREMGGIRLIGPAIVLERDWTSSVTGFLSLRWTLLSGGPQSTDVVDSGEFLGGGMLQRSLTQGGQYTLRMAGSVSVRESNLVFNDAFNGIAVAATWVIRPPSGAAGAAPDAAVELLGVPTIRPQSDPLVPDRSDWNIILRDISRSRRDSSQVGLHISWTKSGSTSSGYGGKLDVGGGAEVSGSSSQSVSTSDEGVLPAFFRFTHDPIYGPPAP